jgi:hypothetical protein
VIPFIVSLLLCLFWGGMIVGAAIVAGVAWLGKMCHPLFGSRRKNVRAAQHRRPTAVRYPRLLRRIH